MGIDASIPPGLQIVLKQTHNDYSKWFDAAVSHFPNQGFQSHCSSHPEQGRVYLQRSDDNGEVLSISSLCMNRQVRKSETCESFLYPK